MKKFILSLFAVSAITLGAFAQVNLAAPVCKILEPASVEGSKTFLYASWGGNLNITVPGNFVEDTLIIAEDGTVGNSTSTFVHPLSQEGCFAYTNAAAVAGKIAVVYRGGCPFVQKGQMAQAAGAVGLLVINNTTGLNGMSGSNASITIPVVIIENSAGQPVVDAMDTVVARAFIGNKNGVYSNDLYTNQDFYSISKYASIPSGMTKHLDFSPNIKYYNIGTQDQFGTTVNCQVSRMVGSTEVIYYTETSPAQDIPVGDSITYSDTTAYVFPIFSYEGLANGVYTIKYTISLGSGIDDDLSDNILTSTFNINPNMLSYTRLDANNVPINTSYPATTVGTSSGVYNSCVTVRASDTLIPIVEGIHFSISSDTALVTGDLTNLEVTLGLYQWPDVTTYANIIQLLTEQTYLTDNNDNKQMKYHALSSKWQLDPGSTYLVCAETVEHDRYHIGADDHYHYQGNFEFDGLVAGPWSHAGTWTRWKGGLTTGLGLQMQYIAYVGTEEKQEINASIYPNPVNDLMTIKLNAKGKATVLVADLTGKLVSQSTLNFTDGSAQLNMDSLDAGMYVCYHSTGQRNVNNHKHHQKLKSDCN